MNNHADGSSWSQGILWSLAAGAVFSASQFLDGLMNELLLNTLRFVGLAVFVITYATGPSYRRARRTYAALGKPAEEQYAKALAFSLGKVGVFALGALVGFAVIGMANGAAGAPRP